MKLLVLVVALAACGSSSTDEPAEPPPAPRPMPIAPPPVDAAVPAPPPPPMVRLPEGVAPLSYDVVLELDPSLASFHGKVDILVHIDRPVKELYLHAAGLKVEAVSGASFGASLPNEIDRLTLPVETAGDLRVHIEYTGSTAGDQEGLFVQEFGGKKYLFSQAESVFARRIVPCFDEPRFKVPWRVTVIAPKGMTALANAPEEGRLAGPDGKTAFRFAQIDALPSYLFAVAVGPFSIVDGGKVGRNKIPFRIATFPGREKAVAFAVARTPKIVAALEDYFAMPLPLAKLDFVAVPELFGAMEHPGLVTYEAEILFADRELIRVAAHELAHQWTGNLVTPAWWNDLWLSESFASFVGDHVAELLGGFDDPVLHEQLARRQALAADADPAAHALVTPIIGGHEVDDTFDAITYEKGQAVLAMVDRYLGGTVLRDVLRAYVTKHAGGNVTTADFTSALAAATTPELGAALDAIAHHAGAPILDLSLRCDDKPALVGGARDGLSLPACARLPGKKHVCGIAGAKVEWPLDACPAWAIGNEGGDFYYRVGGDLALPPFAQLTPPERLAVGDDVAAAARRGDLVPAAAIDDLVKLAKQPDPYAQLAALGIARAIDPIVGDAQRPAWSAFLGATFAKRVTAPALLSPRTPGERALRDAILATVPADQYAPDAVKRARAVVDRQLAAKHPDLEDLSLALAVAGRSGGPALAEKVIARADELKDDELLSLLGAFGPEVAPRVVELAAKRGGAAPIVEALVDMLERGDTRAAAWSALHGGLPLLVAMLGTDGAKRMATALGALCDKGARDAVAAALPRQTGAISRIDRCIARRAAGPVVLP